MREPPLPHTSAPPRASGRRGAYAIDVVLFTPRGRQLAVLCDRLSDPRAHERWQLPNDAVEGGETLEAAARRIVRSAVGTEPTWIAQVGAFADGRRSEREPALRVHPNVRFDLAGASPASTRGESAEGETT